MIATSTVIRKTFVLLLLLIPLLAMGNKSRQALKALEEGDFEKVIEFLEKSVERDSLNPNTEYVYAKLYITDSFPDYNVDKAHFYALRSIDYLDQKSEDHIKEMSKSELTESDFFVLKVYIDERAFDIALNENTITAFERFMSDYANADQLESAIEYRNALAFKSAESKNSWQAYESFFQRYPEAQQADQARDLFQKLVYRKKTQSAEVEELEDFLIEYPDTPYRSEIEQRIFSDISTFLDPIELFGFINKHHNPGLTNRAFGILYHLDKLEKKQLKKFNHPAYKAFSDSVNRLELLQSQLLVPISQGHQYGFINMVGQQMERLAYSEVDPRYLCGNVKDELLIVHADKTKKLINREGNSIYIGEFDDYQDAGDGIIILSKNGKHGAIHKSGFEVLPFDYSELKWLDNGLFAGAKGEYMGLYDFLGKTVVKPVYDDIYLVGQYWVFEKDERLVVVDIDDVKTKGSSYNASFDESYEEVELIDSTYLIAFDEDNEVLLNKKLEKLAPPSTERINTRFSTWVFQKPLGYQIFDKKTGYASDVVYDDVLQNNEWLGLKRDDKWEVRSKNISDEPILGLDSVKLLGEDIVIIFREQQGMAIFPNKEIVQIEKGEFLTSFGNSIKSDSHFLIVKRDGKNVLYRDGVLLFSTEYPELGYIENNAFWVKEKGKYGAVDEKGKLIMRVRYDAIGQAENGVSSVILNGKFGGYNFIDRVLLRLDFEEKLVAYNEDLFIVKEDGLKGLISDGNKMIVDAEFEEISFWSDTTFLAKEDGVWMVLNMADQKELISGFKTYDFFVNTQNKKVIKFQTTEGWGVYHNTKGIIVPAVYNDIYNLGNESQPLFFAEHSFPEADYYVVVYYDAEGNKIKTVGYSEEDFLKIVCE